ncbi:MAG: PaaI family thioesterase [Myxococcota bacterium]|jgi:uncharacterized protein (TIGR00369 family)|nr:PaaI family thioesterase [Myxococcota bacterium]
MAEQTTELPTDSIFDLMKPDIRHRADGECDIRFDLTGRPNFTIPSGAVQGGIVAVMLDMAMAMSLDGGLTTASLQYEILRPVLPGPIDVSGRIIRRGRRITFAEAVMKNAEGKVLAKGTQTAVTM